MLGSGGRFLTAWSSERWRSKPSSVRRSGDEKRVRQTHNPLPYRASIETSLVCAELTTRRRAAEAKLGARFTAQKDSKLARPGSSNGMGRAAVGVGGGAAMGSAGYSAAAAYLAMRKSEGTWRG